MTAPGLLLFLRQMARNPRQIGAIAPSSSALARLMSRHVRLDPDGIIVEIGAGTGVVTRVLLEAGVPRERLVSVELDSRLHSFLQKRFPGLSILQGDAAELATMLPPHLVGKVSTIVSSLPLKAMPWPVQERIVNGLLAVLRPGGAIVQYTYAPTCPLPAERLGLDAERVGRIWLNLPPASVWRFTRKKPRPA